MRPALFRLHNLEARFAVEINVELGYSLNISNFILKDAVFDYIYDIKESIRDN
jgi:hypothetical protein